MQYVQEHARAGEQHGAGAGWAVATSLLLLALPCCSVAPLAKFGAAGSPSCFPFGVVLRKLWCWKSFRVLNP